MLIQILHHTPLYVWAILAFLIHRGTVAMRDREVEVRKLCILPAAMLVLALQDIAAKFGLDGLALAAWAAGTATAMALAWRRGGSRIVAGAMPGTVRVPGSRMPLAMMLAVFCTKYATSVWLAIQPHAHRQMLCVTAVCLLFGAFNGYFLGRLARDLRAWMSLQAGAGVPAGLREAGLTGPLHEK